MGSDRSTLSYITQNITTQFASVKAYERSVSATRIASVTPRSWRVRSSSRPSSTRISFSIKPRGATSSASARRGRVGWAPPASAGPFFDESANLTLVKATFNDDHAAVPYVPGTVFRSDTALFHALPRTLFGRPVKASLSGGVTYVGHGGPCLTARSARTILTIDASVVPGLGRTTSCAPRVDEPAQHAISTGEYNNASDFNSQAQPTLVPERTFTAGAPRGVFATFGINFGGV